VEELLDGFLEGETVDEPVAAEPAMVEYPRPESKQIEPACTYLGLPEDRESRFAYPETAHLCFASDPGSPIDLEHQSAFCLTQEHRTCLRFVELLPDARSDRAPLSTVPEPEIQRPARFPLWSIVLGGLVFLLVVVVILYNYFGFVFQPGPIAGVAGQATPSPTASLTATSTPTEGLTQSSPTPAPVAILATPAVTATPLPGDRVYTLSPAAGDIGWVASDEERGNHFGDSFLYAGIYEGQVHQAAFQLDLSTIPRGAPIHQASLQLAGLRDDRLGDGGVWTLRLLAPDVDQDWRRHSYQEIFNALAVQALTPILEYKDLAVGQTNTFELSPAQIKILEERIVEDENPKVSFRIDGPLVGPDNLFAWDTGYGPQSRGNRVSLSLSVGPPPATPPPYDYLVVTSTPTPENVLTAAAISLQKTADATRIGTATPVPPNMVTATPIPDYLVIVPTPTPENEATAQALAVLATAQAFVAGTPTPVPTNAVTATPTPTPTSTSEPSYVVITATPTPESVFVAATLSAAGTAQAITFGTPTPLPANWVTPIVVTSTPTPANQATAQFLAAVATAQAFTTGTPTPTPVNVFTATPTPVFIVLEGELPPMTPTPTSTVVPSRLPAELIGKIAFKSDRSGQEEIYVINLDGSGLALLSDPWPYELARQADAYSADGRYQVFVKDAVHWEVGQKQLLPALYVYDYLYSIEEQITFFGGGIAYDPAWSPSSEQIAFVSDDSGNDEIWIINGDGSDARQLTRNEWEWDKHPSWSPDGTQIVFWSNRTGAEQIWVMDADGGNLSSLSRTGFNDWDPVWIKYPDIPESRAEP
jgi:hypothetical protein